MKDMDMEKCFFGEGAIKQRGSITGGLLFAWQCRKGGSQKMILYFSATGNGKYIAEQIAEKTDEKCMSIVDCICEDKYCFSNEKIFGMVVPTYFWRLPRIVAEYLGKLRIENCGYTFFLTSYGATTGEAGSMAKKIMAHNGQNFDAYYSVIMPDTWTPVFDLTNKNRVDKWLSDGKKQLKLVIGNIMSKRKGNFVDRKLYSRKPEL